MKYLAILIVGFAAFVTADEEWKPITDHVVIRKIHNDCFKEAKVTQEQLEKLRNFERPHEKEIHEYVLCNVKKVGVFTENDGFMVDRLLAQLETMRLNMDKAREIVTKCVDGNEQKSSPAVWAFRNIECMMANNMDKLIRAAQDEIKENCVRKD